MDAITRRRLNWINREFYRLTVEDFDESRGRPWPGWKRLLASLSDLPDLSEAAALSVLDVGCGNGRFGRFLARHWAAPIRYHGLDSNPDLLMAARAAFARMNILPDARLEARDIVENPPDDGLYDLVAVFGVLHHVPGRDFRRDLMRLLAERVGPGGVLVITAWQFWDHARFRERTVTWPADLEREPGDHLLDWRRGHAANTALRYCHHIDEAELDALVAATGLREIARYSADGHTGDINRYAVMRRGRDQ